MYVTIRRLLPPSSEVQGAIKDVENTVTNQGNRGSVQAIQKQVLEAGITPQILAARYNIREDAAATILNKDLSVRNTNGTVTPLYKLDEFDDLTGKYRGPLRPDLLKAAVDAAQKPDVVPLPPGIVSALAQRVQIAQELQDEAQKGIVIVPSTPNVAKEVLTLALLTSPVWGQYVYRRWCG